jgi:hypothetical protein
MFEGVRARVVKGGQEWSRVDKVWRVASATAKSRVRLQANRPYQQRACYGGCCPRSNSYRVIDMRLLQT